MASQPNTNSANTKSPPAPAATPLPAGTPLPSVPSGYKDQNEELYNAWVDHIKVGYENNDQVFQRILDAFMRSHNSTVVMNWILFVIGIGFFITSVILAVFQASPVAGIFFGGLSIGSFLTYFISRPTQAIEENLQYVTWLGVIYNSYWTRLAWSFDEDTAQSVLDDATEDAIRQLNQMIDHHALSTSKRPKPQEGPAAALEDMTSAVNSVLGDSES